MAAEDLVFAVAVGKQQDTQRRTCRKWIWALSVKYKYYFINKQHRIHLIIQHLNQADHRFNCKSHLGRVMSTANITNVTVANTHT